MLNLDSLLQKTSSTKRIILLLFSSQIIFLLMITYVFPVINNTTGIQALDLHTFGYSLSTVQTIINNLDSRTISLYLFPQLFFLDILYPVLLAFFLSSLLFRLVALTKTQGKFTPLLYTCPFLAMMCDYVENIYIALFISRTIDITETAVFISSFFTLSKGIFTSISWVLILIFSMKWLSKKIGPNFKNQLIHWNNK